MSEKTPITPPVRILFMDDLIDQPGQFLLSDAVQRLRERGFEVTTVATMSEAIDAFYQCFYQVFVLDIDMSHREDEIDGRGTRVARRLLELDNQTRVVMYSAMGTAEDIFHVVNRHVYGYVFKDDTDPVGKLVEVVTRAATEPAGGQFLPDSRPAGLVLQAVDPSSPYSAELLAESLRKHGDYTLETLEIGAIPGRLQQEGACVAVFLGRASFSTHPDTLACLREICAFQPKPQVVIGCNCDNAQFNSLMALANMRPFRLVQADAVDAIELAARALAEAAHWYGGNETFKADPGYVHRVGPDIDWTSMKSELDIDDEEMLPEPEDDFPGDGKQK